MSIFRDDCIFHGQLLADFAKQFAKSPKAEETAEDRWEFDQQTEALYQARINKPIDPPFPAVTSKPTSDNSAHEAQDVAVLIPVNQIDEE